MRERVSVWRKGLGIYFWEHQTDRQSGDERRSGQHNRNAVICGICVCCVCVSRQLTAPDVTIMTADSGDARPGNWNTWIQGHNKRRNGWRGQSSRANQANGGKGRSGRSARKAIPFHSQTQSSSLSSSFLMQAKKKLAA